MFVVQISSNEYRHVRAVPHQQQTTSPSTPSTPTNPTPTPSNLQVRAQNFQRSQTQVRSRFIINHMGSKSSVEKNINAKKLNYSPSRRKLSSTEGGFHRFRYLRNEYMTENQSRSKTVDPVYNNLF